MGKIIILSESLWKELGGQENNLLGEDLILNDMSFRVFGVMPNSFFMGYSRADLWVPRIFRPGELESENRNNHSFNSIAKLKPDVSVEQANQNLRNVYEAFMELYPEDRDDQQRSGATFGAVNINASMMQNMGQIEMAFKSIQWVTLVVLIIGCLNVGGMILVKGYSRIQELAIRQGSRCLRLSFSATDLCRDHYLFPFGWPLQFARIEIGFLGWTMAAHRRNSLGRRMAHRFQLVVPDGRHSLGRCHPYRSHAFGFSTS